MKKKGCLILIAVIAITCMSSSSKLLTNEPNVYNVVEIYKQVKLEEGTKVADRYGSLMDVGYMYIPIEPTKGTFSVRLIKEGDKLYHVRNTDIYLYLEPDWGTFGFSCLDWHKYDDMTLIIGYNSKYYNHKRGTLVCSN